MSEKSKTARFEKLQEISQTGTAYTLVYARKFLEDFPDHSGALIEYGMTLVEIARYDEAQNIFDKVISLVDESQLYFPHAQLGHLYFEMGDIQEAIKWYEKALKIAPDDATFNIFLGSAYAKLGNLDKALSCHRKALSCAEGAIDEAYLNIGFIMRAKEKFEEAKFNFEKALEIEPNYEEAIEALKDINSALDSLQSA